jgi:hypothetical protein
LDGKLDTKAPLTLNTVYDGPEVKIALFTYDSLLWVAANYKQNLNNTHNYLRAVEIALELFAALKEKGVQRIYCTAETESAIRFNEGLGFELVGATVQDRHEVMVKEFSNG